MTDQIKVSEVSAILRQQLEGISTGIRTEEVGTVLQVSDRVARIYGLDNAEANELLQFDNGMEAIVMNLEEDNVGAVLLGPTDQVKEGDIVKRTGRIASINVSEGMIGRVIDPLGNPIDGKGEITTLIDDEARVYKGGSWKDRAYWLNPGSRRYMNQKRSSNDIGFRCAMSHVGNATGGKKNKVSQK